jgi:hypothetical protein
MAAEFCSIEIIGSVNQQMQTEERENPQCLRLRPYPFRRNPLYRVPRSMGAGAGLCLHWRGSGLLGDLAVPDREGDQCARRRIDEMVWAYRKTPGLSSELSSRLGSFRQI